jgi:predicted  nucleic acid-binding Zn-ribbon protein
LTRAQIESLHNDTKRALEDKIGSLEEKLEKSLSEEIKVTSDYTKELYARFERMVWVGLILLAGVAAFVGYQTFSSIPDKITAEISRIATEKGRQVETFFTKAEEAIKTRNSALEGDQQKLKARLAEIDTELNAILDEGNRKASEKVEQIAATYDSRFRDFQTDWYVQLAKGQAGITEIVPQLVQTFPNADPVRQAGIAGVFAETDIPSNLISTLMGHLETWKPQNDIAASIRYQVLVRYRSELAKSEIEGN